jgi:hypothetical protein
VLSLRSLELVRMHRERTGFTGGSICPICA